MANYLTREDALGIITSTCKFCNRPIEKKIYGDDNSWYHTEGMWAWGHLPIHDIEPTEIEDEIENRMLADSLKKLRNQN
jgi:hypothetical protein